MKNLLWVFIPFLNGHLNAQQFTLKELFVNRVNILREMEKAAEEIEEVGGVKMYVHSTNYKNYRVFDATIYNPYENPKQGLYLETDSCYLFYKLPFQSSDSIPDNYWIYIFTKDWTFQKVLMISNEFIVGIKQFEYYRDGHVRAKLLLPSSKNDVKSINEVHIEELQSIVESVDWILFDDEIYTTLGLSKKFFGFL